MSTLVGMLLLAPLSVPLFPAVLAYSMLAFLPGGL